MMGLAIIFNDVWRRHAGSVLLLLLAILLANALAITGIYHDDPALFVSNLAAGVVRGPVPGFPNWFDPNIGYTTQALGHLCAQDWLHGVIPWWDPYQGVGAPLAAELQNGAFFLPFSLLLHFKAGWLMVRLLMQMMAGLFTYALLIQLRLSRLAALLGGVMFGCSSTFIILADAPSNTLPFLPLLLLGIELGLASHRRFAPGWSLVIIAIAYSFYGGFPETGLLADFFGGLWFVIRLMDRERSAWLSMIGRFTITIGTSLILILPGLIPFVQYVRTGAIGIHAMTSASDALPLIGLTFQMLPLSFGPIGAYWASAKFGSHQVQSLISNSLSAGGWIGLIPVMLSFSGLFATSPVLRRIRWLLLIWIMLFESRTFGLPLAMTLINLVPPLRLIELRRYAEPSIDFAIILLATFGFDQWFHRGFSKRILVLIYALAAAILSGSLIISVPINQAIFAGPSVFWRSELVYDMAMMIAGIIVLYALSQPATSPRRLVVSAIVIVDCVVGFGFSQAAGAAHGRLDLSGITFLQNNQGLRRAYSLGPLAPNYGSQYRVSEIDTNMLPIPRNWSLFIHRNLDPYQSTISFIGADGHPLPAQDGPAHMLRQNLPAYQALGVRYILTPPYTDPLHTAQNPVFISKAMWIYRLDHAAPYYATTPGSACAISMPKRTRVRIECAKPAALIRRELFYSGWHARVNGHAVAVRPAAPLFQTIDLPAGRSNIRFFYRPPFERRACAAAGLGLLLWLALVLIDAKRRVVR
jgi:hypothetical protein